jgi:hypothetical protein
MEVKGRKGTKEKKKKKKKEQKKWAIEIRFSSLGEKKKEHQ